MSLYKRFDRKARTLIKERSARRAVEHYIDLRTQQGLPVVKLTKDQKEQVQQAWNGRVKRNAYGTYDLVLSATEKFDPYICSGPFFQGYIEPKLNNSYLKHGFSDKNYFDRLFPDVPMPKTVIRNINGVLMDAQYHPLTEAEALRIMNDHERLIAKPSLENGGGKGVTLFENEEFSEICKKMNRNFIVQEVVRQYSGVSALNPSSVNVVRVVSLSLNGRISPVSCALRCGAAGAIVDNYITKDGRGMFVVGVNSDGTLKDEAYYPCGERLDLVTPGGVRFAGLQLPNYEEAMKLTTRIHEVLPHFGVIGFDLCFDEAGSPRMIEYNVRVPGSLYYQYVNGPLFGDRTQEVIETLCK